MQRVLVALCLAGQCTALVPNGVTARSNGKAPLKVLNCVQNRILRARRRGGSAAAAAQRHAVASLVENETSNKSTAFRPSSAPPPRPDTTHPPRNNTKTQAATLERVAPTAPIFSDVCSETGVTLSRFMIETALANPELSELESIFSSIETASKTISNLVRRSSLTGLTGYLDSGTSTSKGKNRRSSTSSRTTCSRTPCATRAAWACWPPRRKTRPSRSTTTSRRSTRRRCSSRRREVSSRTTAPSRRRSRRVCACVVARACLRPGSPWNCTRRGGAVERRPNSAAERRTHETNRGRRQVRRRLRPPGRLVQRRRGQPHGHDLRHHRGQAGRVRPHRRRPRHVPRDDAPAGQLAGGVGLRALLERDAPLHDARRGHLRLYL